MARTRVRVRARQGVEQVTVAGPTITTSGQAGDAEHHSNHCHEAAAIRTNPRDHPDSPSSLL
jgi:hypothetical protein